MVMHEGIVEVSDGSFDDIVLRSSGPVLLDFWADWCTNCKAMEPVIREVAEEYGDVLTVAKLDVDHNPNTPTGLGVRSIPTLVLFKDGQVKAQIVGSQSKSRLAEFLKENL